MLAVAAVLAGRAEAGDRRRCAQRQGLASSDSAGWLGWPLSERAPARWARGMVFGFPVARQGVCSVPSRAAAACRLRTAWDLPSNAAQRI